MNNLIGIVNYGIAGNIHSVKKAIEKAGGSTLVINKPEDFDRVDKIVIPGVGSFKDAMQELENDAFIKPLKNFDGPLLGICLGMQLLMDSSEEGGRTSGLGLIPGNVRYIHKKEAFNSSVNLRRNSSMSVAASSLDISLRSTFPMISANSFLYLSVISRA